MLPDWQVITLGISFLVPVLLNRIGALFAARTYLCWLPSIGIMAVYIYQLQEKEMIYGSFYDSLYIYLLGISGIPYLINTTRKKRQFLLNLSVPVVILFSCEYLLDISGVGYSQRGITDEEFPKNTMRVKIAYAILSTGCFVLKYKLDEGEKKNEVLISQLADKNRIIQERARRDLQDVKNSLDNTKSELENSQSRLLENERRLSRVFNATSDVVWEWDFEKNNYFSSSRWNELIGRDDLEMHPEIYLTICHPDDRQQVLHAITDVLYNPDTRGINIEFRVWNKTGQWKWISMRGHVVSRNFYNKVILVSGTCSDISDRKNAELELKMSEEKYRSIFENIQDIFIQTDVSGRILEISPSIELYIGEKRHDLIGKSIYDYFDDPEDGQKILSILILSEELRDYELRFKTAENEHIFVSVNFMLSRDHHGNPEKIEGILRDITERKRKQLMEDQLNQADKQITELKMMALRSAMNPHFIFNTLNSIQYFILKNETLSAVNYLSAFSCLIRSILNNSVSQKIRLSDELDQLRYYIQLELLRFENKFDFKIEIADELDTDNIEISSLLVQPYVENAIIHGLCNKEGKGLLKISVEEDKQVILFTIEDNGIGRESSAKFKLNNVPGHRSLGTKLTEERLKLMNDQTGLSCHVEDLYEDGRPAGTRVKLWIR
jgi:PAS domain S-box-containing protein